MQRVIASLTAAFSTAIAIASLASTALLATATTAHAANTDPIILVHGFAGFGRDEALGYKYWGGLDDLEVYLTSQGRTTKTAVVGPVSSNWDRAVELYYQIKGGCVDYGSSHAAHFGHDRTVPGKCFTGLYPQWDAAHPVHIVSHSMGGQTAKMLVHLLEANGAPHNTGLFGGAKRGWIKSVTAISSPLNGTTLANVVGNDIPFVVDVIGGIAALTGISNKDNFIYNFKLEQWDLKRYPGERFSDYQNRIVDSPIWEHPVARKDLSLWVLSPDGAAEENAWVQTWSNVYYFSFATNSTFTGIFTGWEYPTATTNPLTLPFVYPAAWPLPPGVGNYTNNKPGQAVIDKSWWPNDAVVNTKSMVAPWNSSSVAVSWNGTAQRGKWNYMGLSGGFDHFDIIGWSLFWDARAFYLAHANRLRAL